MVVVHGKACDKHNNHLKNKNKNSTLRLAAQETTVIYAAYTRNKMLIPLFQFFDTPPQDVSKKYCSQPSWIEVYQHVN